MLDDELEDAFLCIYIFELEIDFQTVSFFFVDLLSVLPVDLTCPIEQGHDLGGAFFGCLYFIFHIYDL